MTHRDWHSVTLSKLDFLYIPLYGLFEILYQKTETGQQRVCQFENWILGKEHRNISRQAEWRRFYRAYPRSAYTFIIIDLGGSVYVHLIHGIICNVGK